MVSIRNGAFANVKVDESIEKLIGHITNIEINDPVLKELEASMGTDVSLLAVLGSRSIIEMLNEELIEYDSETFEITLSDGIQASIEANT